MCGQGCKILTIERPRAPKPFWREEKRFYYAQGKVQQEGVPPGPPLRRAPAPRPATVPAPWARATPPVQQPENPSLGEGQAAVPGGGQAAAPN